jgi:hypothetical protein
MTPCGHGDLLDMGMCVVLLPSAVAPTAPTAAHGCFSGWTFLFSDAVQKAVHLNTPCRSITSSSPSTFKELLMDLPTTLSYLRPGWYRGIGHGFQINVQLGTLLATLVVSILLTRIYVRRRNSVLKSIQGPPSSSYIFGWSLWHTFAMSTRLIQWHRE